MKLSSSFVLITRAFKLFFFPRNFIRYLVIGILPLVLLLGCIAVASVFIPKFIPVLVSLFPGGRAEIGTVLLLLSGTTLLTFALFFIGSFYSATLYRLHYAIANTENIDVWEIIGHAWRSTGRLLVVSFFRGVIILLGLLLLVIPGIVFIVWFTFTPIIAVLEDPNVDPFMTSKNMISGRFWPVVWRLVVFSMLSLIPHAILREMSSIAGTLWILTSPFFGLLLVLLYRDVKATSARG